MPRYIRLGLSRLLIGDQLSLLSKWFMNLKQACFLHRFVLVI